MNRVVAQAEPMQQEMDYLAMMMFGLVVSTALIAVPVFGFLYGYSWVDWTLFGAFYLTTGLGITVGYHRLIAHRSFTCPAAIKVVFLIAGGWAFQNSALKWCSDHIRHHARTDQEEDPYNATKGFWYSHCGWIFFKDPNAHEKYMAPFRKDRWVMWQHRYYVPIVVSGFVLPFLAGFLYGGWRSGVGCFLLAGAGRAFLVLNSTFCINSLCHLWGDQPYETRDSSCNSFCISLITFGEGYHNYHHAYPRDYRNGAEWYHFDPSKWLIFGLSRTGLAAGLARRDPKLEFEG